MEVKLYLRSALFFLCFLLASACTITDISSVYDRETILPARPSGLQAEAVNSTSIRLCWQDNARGEDGYRIYCSSNSVQAEAEKFTAASDTVSFDVSGLVPYVYYSFWVEAFNNRGSSRPLYTVQAAGCLPPAVTNLKISPESNTINLCWDKPETNVESLTIFYSRDNNDSNQFSLALPASATNCTISGLYAGRVYFLKIITLNPAGRSAPCLAAVSTTGENATVPLGPVNVNADPLDSHRLALSWEDQAVSEQGFRLYLNYEDRKPTEAQPQAQVPADSEYYLLDNLKKGAFYYLWLESYNTFGSSKDTAFTCLMPGLPVPPDNFSLVTIDHTTITASWRDRDNSESTFNLYISNQNSKPAVPAAELAYGAESYTADKLAVKTWYYFWLEAENGNGTTVPLPASNRTDLPPAIDGKIIDDSFNLEIYADGVPFYRHDHRMQVSLTMSDENSFLGSSALKWHIYDTNGYWSDIWIRMPDDAKVNLGGYTNLHLAAAATADIGFKILIDKTGLTGEYEILELTSAAGWQEFNIPLPSALNLSGDEDLEAAATVMDIIWNALYPGNPVISPAAPYEVTLYIDELYFE